MLTRLWGPPRPEQLVQQGGYLCTHHVRPECWPAAIGLHFGSAPPCGARADELSDLRDRLEAQEQKIRVLERKLELNDEAAKAAVPTTPIVRASPQQGFRIQSADGANVARLRGYCISTAAISPTTSRRHRGYVDSASRATDLRRHVQQYL